MGKNRRSNHTGIIRLAVAAFLTDNVKVNLGRVVTVVAQNPHLQVSRKRRSGVRSLDKEGLRK